jgi:hypothetical protein
MVPGRAFDRPSRRPRDGIRVDRGRSPPSCGGVRKQRSAQLNQPCLPTRDRPGFKVSRMLNNRLVRTIAYSVVSVAVAASAVLAQGVGTSSAPANGGQKFDLRPLVGAYLPTGDQRDLLKDAVLVGGQVSYHIIPQLAVTGTFAWSPSKDKLTANTPKLNLYQYDVGVEARGAGWVQHASWDFTPFVGIGVGGRTYDYSDLDVDSRTNFDGYGALGGDFGFGRLGVRIEARDYLSQFKPLTGSGDSKTRNDIALAAGLTVRL